MSPFTFLPLLAITAAAATPAPSADAVSLVLVVASNRGAQLDRPPLQYAAADGAKYHAVFASMAGEDHTILLTDLDRDTARLFPGLVAAVRSPTRGNVEAAAARLAAEAAEARRAGRPVRFYFVFAGHGDVELGRGFLELVDGPFTSDDLDALLHRVDADEAHVILDSCNSFFVLNPRKPGGRRFVTPRDAAESLARRLPDVGVFLSTSAEAEVYEWSELQSGVFSHAVRSGLMGAADARRDGRITYEELEAFVETASAEIKNPHFRPKVFARGPNGDNGRVLFDLSRTRSVTLKVDEPGAARLVVRDGEGVRWLDAHKEPGDALALRLPASLASGLLVERLRTGERDAVTVEARYAVPADAADPVMLAALTPVSGSPHARGFGDVYRALFARPFGPEALAAHLDARARAPEPVFGASREERTRLALRLHQLAAAERQNRLVLGYGRLMIGTVLAGVSVYTLRQPRFDGRGELAAAGFATAALNLGFGLHDFSSRSDGERAQERFRGEMAAPGADEARIAAETEARLLPRIERERGLRRRSAAAGWLVAGIGATLLAVNEAVPSAFEENKDVGRLFATTYLSLGLAHGLAMTLAGDPAANALRSWHDDAELRRLPSLSLAPVPGGGMLTLSGDF